MRPGRGADLVSGLRWAVLARMGLPTAGLVAGPARDLLLELLTVMRARQRWPRRCWIASRHRRHRPLMARRRAEIEPAPRRIRSARAATARSQAPGSAATSTRDHPRPSARCPQTSARARPDDRFESARSVHAVPRALAPLVVADPRELSAAVDLAHRTRTATRSETARGVTGTHDGLDVVLVAQLAEDARPYRGDVGRIGSYAVPSQIRTTSARIAHQKRWVKSVASMAIV